MDDRTLQEKVIAFRRALHRIPEIGFDLPKTRAYLTSHLATLGCEIRDLGPAGFTAYFAAAAAAETIAFRTDMDALPVEEAGESDYRSEHAGAMHACGHDGHMSILLGLATWVSEHRAAIGKNVLLVFQAAEETTGGAKIICGTGVLKDYGVSRIYGLHLWPGYPKNVVVCRPEAFMAGTVVLGVGIAGHSVHIAEYQKGADALEAGCRFVEQAYAMEKALPDEVFRLLRFGDFHSGTADNVVADSANIRGVMRAYDDAIFDAFWDGMHRIAAEIEADTDVRFSFRRSEGYPPVVNPAALYDAARAVLTKAGFTWFELPAPILPAEDFSYYQREVPGLFFHLGTGVDAKLHACDYTIDEDVLLTGVKLFRALLQ
ncbi:MAG: amidohydrolase [Clostridiales Family XIII bacterium]|jgi:hippurate hydrolase|nr:amidohydrolase [Clostridiales Family XIII bacterium]